MERLKETKETRDTGEIAINIGSMHDRAMIVWLIM